MQDNVVKKSLRIYGRMLLWLLRIIVSPFYLIFMLMLIMAFLAELLYAWAVNDEDNFNAKNKVLADVFDSIVKWFTI